MGIRPLSRQLEENTSRDTVRVYYQADLIINKSEFNKFVDRLVQEKWEPDVEQAIWRALAELADGIKVNHPDIRGIENPKIFITEPMPTSDDFSL